MCGRFAQKTTAKSLAEHFDLDLERIFFERPRFNIAPSQKVFAIRVTDEKRTPAVLQWGLIPSWTKDPKIAHQLINARSETVQEKPAFRAAFKKRRCLIPATGFYEWQKQGEKKKPFYFGLKEEGQLFAMAGLWEEWASPAGEVIETFTILTTQANPLVAPIHNRMPVMIDPRNYAEWLDPDLSQPKSLEHLLTPYDPKGMAFREVSQRVNNPRNDDESLLY